MKYNVFPPLATSGLQEAFPASARALLDREPKISLTYLKAMNQRAKTATARIATPSPRDAAVDSPPLLQGFEAILLLPKIMDLIAHQQLIISELREDVKCLRLEIKNCAKEDDGWIGTQKARQYIDDASPETFEKYINPKKPGVKLSGKKVNGKNLFNKKEIDKFVIKKDFEAKQSAALEARDCLPGLRVLPEP